MTLQSSICLFNFGDAVFALLAETNRCFLVFSPCIYVLGINSYQFHCFDVICYQFYPFFLRSTHHFAMTDAIFLLVLFIWQYHFNCWLLITSPIPSTLAIFRIQMLELKTI